MSLTWFIMSSSFIIWYDKRISLKAGSLHLSFFHCDPPLAFPRASSCLGLELWVCVGGKLLIVRYKTSKGLGTWCSKLKTWDHCSLAPLQGRGGEQGASQGHQQVYTLLANPEVKTIIIMTIIAIIIMASTHVDVARQPCSHHHHQNFSVSKQSICTCPNRSSCVT